jgi:hypothetical protein
MQLAASGPKVQWHCEVKNTTKRNLGEPGVVMRRALPHYATMHISEAKRETKTSKINAKCNNI